MAIPESTVTEIRLVISELREMSKTGTFFATEVKALADRLDRIQRDCALAGAMVGQQDLVQVSQHLADLAQDMIDSDGGLAQAADADQFLHETAFDLEAILTDNGHGASEEPRNAI